MRSFSLTAAFALATMPVAASCVANLPTKTAKTPVTIPSQFQGVWDADAATCAALVSDMRQYIGPDGMRFGDAVGEVRRVLSRARRSASILTSFLSDGDPWEGEVQLTLSPAGDQLTVKSDGRSTTRQRCSSSS
jgi:hypothetical protein